MPDAQHDGVLDTPPTPIDVEDEDLVEEPPANARGDVDVDSSEQGPEDEPDWVPMDAEALGHLDDEFNRTFSDDMVAIVDTLQTLGVGPLEATRYASKCVHVVQ